MGNCSLIWSGHIYSAKADRSSYTCTYESDHKQQSATFRSGFFPVEVKILACMQHNGKTHALQSDNNSFLGSIHSWCCALTVHCSCTMSSLQQVFCVFLLLGQLQQLNTIYPYFFTQKKRGNSRRLSSFRTQALPLNCCWQESQGMTMFALENLWTSPYEGHNQSHNQASFSGKIS